MDELMELVEPDKLDKPKGEALRTLATSAITSTSAGAQPLANANAATLPLHNAKPPYYQNQRERYTHRIMLEKAAQGYTVKEIAEQTGYTTVAVNNILRQPY